jgi:hypothetical protein
MSKSENQVMVKLVKYDMDKTKKRNRKNFLVEDKSVEAIIEKLERIHKGEKVVELKEVVWAEVEVEKEVDEESEEDTKLD